MRRVNRFREEEKKKRRSLLEYAQAPTGETSLHHHDQHDNSIRTLRALQ